MFSRWYVFSFQTILLEMTAAAAAATTTSKEDEYFAHD